MSTIGTTRKIRTFDEVKVGTIIQALFNPDPNKFLALDGGDYNAGDWPELVNDSTGKRIFPGVFTSTARTLNVAPAAATISSNGTVFVVSGSAGINALIGSSDGITWSSASDWAASTQFNSIINTPSRLIYAGAGGDAAAPYVSSNAATPYAKANSTATTGGTTTTLTQGLAYGSTANAGAGRTVLCVNGSLATASGLFYMNDGATVWSACSGGSTVSRKAICWSGKNFVVAVQSTANGNAVGIQISSDGATFVDQIVPLVSGATNGIYSIASDGNGTVVISTGLFIGQGSPAGFLVSKDHGVSWKSVIAPSDAGQLNGPISYVNGRFIASGSSQAYFYIISFDGLTWITEPIQQRGAAPINSSLIFRDGVAYKAGTYCFVGTTTAAMTATENMAKFKLPLAETNNAVEFTNQGKFIKARS